MIQLLANAYGKSIKLIIKYRLQLRRAPQLMSKLLNRHWNDENWVFFWESKELKFFRMKLLNFVPGIDFRSAATALKYREELTIGIRHFHMWYQ